MSIPDSYNCGDPNCDACKAANSRLPEGTPLTSSPSKTGREIDNPTVEEIRMSLQAALVADDFGINAEGDAEEAIMDIRYDVTDAATRAPENFNQFIELVAMLSLTEEKFVEAVAQRRQALMLNAALGQFLDAL